MGRACSINREVVERCLQRGVPLAGRTSFEIGGEASEFYLPQDCEELREVCHYLSAEGRSPYVLGGGCNTLFPDGQFERPVISTARLKTLEVIDRRMRAGAGARLEVLIGAAMQAGLGGLEHFAGIPGTAGGAVAMNAGGAGYSFGDRVALLEGIRLETGEREVIGGSDVAWDYRTSHLDGFLVTGVELELTPADRSDLRQRTREILRKKAAQQPLATANAGCIFRNPRTGHSAAALIDRSGLKGAREGGAVVSDRHANFIINEKGTATARDVLALLARVRETVRENFGVTLEPEIIIPSLS